MLQTQAHVAVLQFEPIGHRDCSTFDTFMDGDAETIETLLLSALRRQSSAMDAPARLLLASIPPVLVHARRNSGTPITHDNIRLGFAFRSLWDLATANRVHVRDPHTGAVMEVLMPNFPAALITPIRDYLSGLPGCDLSRPLSDRQAVPLAKHHDRAMQHIVPALMTLGASLGHLFKVCNDDNLVREPAPDCSRHLSS